MPPNKHVSTPQTQPRGQLEIHAYSAECVHGVHGYRCIYLRNGQVSPQGIPTAGQVKRYSECVEMGSPMCTYLCSRYLLHGRQHTRDDRRMRVKKKKKNEAFTGFNPRRIKTHTLHPQ